VSGPGLSPVRVRTGHVAWVHERLGQRDTAIIRSVDRLRLVSSGQLERLHFHDLSIPSRSRIRRRVLARLVAWRVLLTLDRRIGGVRAGSAGLVYALDSCGQQLVRLSAHDEGSSIRRPSVPGLALLHHTLAVSELYVSLHELARSEDFEITAFQTEPVCWWPNGWGGWVKPDAYLCLADDTYTDHWWLEQDMGTEHLPTIKRKLLTYLDFAARGLGPNQIMPRVLVSVPDDTRYRAVKEVIRRLPPPAPELLHVTTSGAAPRYLLRVLKE
jgi:hypothetical protein